jgi:hypothetical protein
MKRTIVINDSVVAGWDMENIVSMIPQLKDSFRQRQQFNEYYFDETEVDANMEQLEALSREYGVKIGSEFLQITI